MFGCPHMFGHPLYAWMTKHAFFVLCVALLATLQPTAISCPKYLTTQLAI